MKHKSTLYITRAAVIAALYAVITNAQNILFPDSASAAVQFRVSETLCILAVFTPVAIPGLTLGCILANLSSLPLLGPLDMIFGSAASCLAAVSMYALRRVRWFGLPVLSALMPALFNGLIVGFEIAFFLTDGGFTLPAYLAAAGFVALGELAVLLVLGLPFAKLTEAARLDVRLFGVKK